MMLKILQIKFQTDCSKYSDPMVLQKADVLVLEASGIGKGIMDLIKGAFGKSPVKKWQT